MSHGNMFWDVALQKRTTLCPMRGFVQYHDKTVMKKGHTLPQNKPTSDCLHNIYLGQRSEYRCGINQSQLKNYTAKKQEKLQRFWGAGIT